LQYKLDDRIGNQKDRITKEELVEMTMENERRVGRYFIICLKNGKIFGNKFAR